MPGSDFGVGGEIINVLTHVCQANDPLATHERSLLLRKVGHAGVSDGFPPHPSPIVAMQENGSTNRNKALFMVVRLTAVSGSLLSGRMIRLAMVLGLAGLACLGACTAEPVGRICDLGTALPAPSEVVVASPSLDCVSRTCLRVPLGRELPMGSMFPEGNNGLCTAECDS